MKQDQQWLHRARGNKAGHRLMMWVLRHGGLVPAYLVLVPAALQYLLLDRSSKDALRQFRRILGIGSGPISLFRHFYSFGMSLIDRYFFLLSKQEIFAYATIREKLIKEELARGRGVILLGAHFGNWELAGNLLGERTGAAIHFLMYDGVSHEVKQAVQSALKNRNAQIIPVSPDRPDTAIEIVNALRKGEIVCLHGDRVLGHQRSEATIFFGKSARFPTGPFSLAAITGASVIPFFAVKTAWRSYAFSAADPIRFDTANRANREQLIKEAVAKYSATLEIMVRQYPCQWYNFFKFWED